MEILHYREESVSVAMEEVKPEDWLEKVYNLTLRTKWTRFIRSQDTMKMTVTRVSRFK